MANIMTIRPPEELKQQLKEHAAKKGITMNGLVLVILGEWAERQKAR